MYWIDTTQDLLAWKRCHSCLTWSESTSIPPSLIFSRDIFNPNLWSLYFSLKLTTWWMSENYPPEVLIFIFSFSSPSLFCPSDNHTLHCSLEIWPFLSFKISHFASCLLTLSATLGDSTLCGLHFSNLINLWRPEKGSPLSSAGIQTPALSHLSLLRGFDSFLNIIKHWELFLWEEILKKTVILP